MNKKIIWILVFLVVLAKASAIGIGAPNVALVPEGIKTIDLYVINDEHKDMTAEISVSGELADRISITQKIVKLSASEEMKRFSVTINFPASVKGDTKITVSEVIENSGQISAFAHASYKLRIVSTEEAKNSEKSKTGEKGSQGSGIMEQVVENIPPEGSKKQIEKLSAEQPNVSLKEIIYKPLPLTLILGAILAIVTSFDVIYVAMNNRQKNKNPLQDYIHEERKIGATDDEIKGKLLEAGWHEEDIERALK